MPKLSVGVWTKIKLRWMSFELDVYFSIFLWIVSSLWRTGLTKTSIYSEEFQVSVFTATSLCSFQEGFVWLSHPAPVEGGLFWSVDVHQSYISIER